MVEAEAKIVHVPEAIGPTFQRFDFDDTSFYRAVGDAVMEVIEQARFVGGQGLCILHQMVGCRKPSYRVSRHRVSKNFAALNSSLFSRNTLSCSFML